MSRARPSPLTDARPGRAPGRRAAPATAATLAALVAASVMAAMSAATSSSAGAAGAARVDYRWPVVAPVTDPFRPPATPYGAGNRGLELDTVPGAVVGAAAPGVVTFAGAVAGSPYVTLQHDDRLRTTYGPLRSLAVAAGDAVAAGAPIGEAGDLLLWTARLGDAYLDPAVLLAASGEPRVHLVADAPADAPPGAPAGAPAGARTARAPAGVSEADARWGLGEP